MVPIQALWDKDSKATRKCWCSSFLKMGSMDVEESRGQGAWGAADGTWFVQLREEASWWPTSPHQGKALSSVRRGSDSSLRRWACFHTSARLSCPNLTRAAHAKQLGFSSTHCHHQVAQHGAEQRQKLSVDVLQMWWQQTSVTKAGSSLPSQIGMC